MAATLRVGSLRKHFRTLHDPRVVGRTSHLLFDIIVLAICGVIANCDDWPDIALFAQKRDVLLDEANAIGTTYLRADFLPEADRRAVRDLLREYVEIRLAAAESGDVAPAIARSEQIHTLLWTRAAANMNANPNSIAGGLFIETLNDTIDLHAKRLLFSVRARIPPTIWLALYSIAFFAFGTMGYHGGLAATSRSFALLTVAVIFSAVIWLIRDIDTAREGSLRVSQQAMIDLRNSMNATP